jgi:hypothetical protein
VSAHARGRDKAAVGEVLELLAIGGGALGLLAAPVLTRCACGVERAVEIGGDDLLVVGELTVERGTLCPWDSRVRNEDVEAAAEIRNGLINCLLDCLRRGDVYLVCLACCVVSY